MTSAPMKRSPAPSGRLALFVAVPHGRVLALDEVLRDARAADRGAGAPGDADAVLAHQRARRQRLGIRVARRGEAPAVTVDVRVGAEVAADDARRDDRRARVDARGGGGIGVGAPAVEQHADVVVLVDAHVVERERSRSGADGVGADVRHAVAEEARPVAAGEAVRALHLGGHDVGDAAADQGALRVEEDDAGLGRDAVAVEGDTRTLTVIGMAGLPTAVRMLPFGWRMLCAGIVGLPGSLASSAITPSLPS